MTDERAKALRDAICQIWSATGAYPETIPALAKAAIERDNEALDRLSALPASASPQAKGGQLVVPEVSRGIRMLCLMKGEHPHHDVYNDAIRLAAEYVDKVWSTPGRGANAPNDNAARPASLEEPQQP